MLKGFFSMLKKENSTNAVELLETAKQRDLDNWPTYYNLACAYARPETTNDLPKEQLDKCIEALHDFQSKTKWSPGIVVSQMEDDKDHLFSNLFSTLSKQVTNQTWQVTLEKKLQETNGITIK